MRSRFLFLSVLVVMLLSVLFSNFCAAQGEPDPEAYRNLHVPWPLHGVSFYWKAPTIGIVHHYQVYLARDGEAAELVESNLTRTPTYAESYKLPEAIKTLLDGHSYQLAVEAVDAAGNVSDRVYSKWLDVGFSTEIHLPGDWVEFSIPIGLCVYEGLPPTEAEVPSYLTKKNVTELGYETLVDWVLSCVATEPTGDPTVPNLAALGMWDPILQDWRYLGSDDPEHPEKALHFLAGDRGYNAYIFPECGGAVLKIPGEQLAPVHLSIKVPGWHLFPPLKKYGYYDSSTPPPTASEIYSRIGNSFEVRPTSQVPLRTSMIAMTPGAYYSGISKGDVSLPNEIKAISPGDVIWGYIPAEVVKKVPNCEIWFVDPEIDESALAPPGVKHLGFNYFKRSKTPIPVPKKPDVVPFVWRLKGQGITPTRSTVLQNYPNPFNPETWIPYQLDKAAEVTVRIYTDTGAIVRTLALGKREPGFYQSKSEAAYWDGSNESGEKVASGVYFVVITMGERVFKLKIAMLK